jgi:intein-encoded DNA endonuclease-like protein
MLYELRKIGTDGQISAKLLSIKFHEYLFSERHKTFVANEPRTVENEYIMFYN